MNTELVYNMFMKKIKQLTVSLLLVALLSACGTDGPFGANDQFTRGVMEDFWSGLDFTEQIAICQAYQIAGEAKLVDATIEVMSDTGLGSETAVLDAPTVKRFYAETCPN